jgi:hypothetical protein
MPNYAMNATNAIASISPSYMGMLITVIVFITIFVMIFLLSKNIRKAIYGGIITSILYGVYKVSRYIGISAEQGNTLPLLTFSKICGFLLVSIIIGHFIIKLPIIKKLEHKIK